MKRLFFIFTFFCLTQAVVAQSPHDAVLDFFDAFHRKDSLQLQSLVADKARLQSTGIDPQGEIFLRNTPMERFIQAVSTRPDKPVWKEVLGTPTVLEDTPLALVWVPYTFYLDESKHHKGVNCFQMIKELTGWKIISIVDTRQPIEQSVKK